jgi:photosystem II stability/assembly factor-like uncharacterized protein
VGEPGWQAFPVAGVPVEVAAAGARRAGAGFGVGDAVFASPAAGWAYVGDGETAQCRVLFTGDAGATWSQQLAWRGFCHRLAAFGEHQAGIVLAVSQGDDINGYRPEPHAAGDPFVGPDMFLAGTQDAGATWTLAPNPDRGTTGIHFLTPRRIWLKVWLSGLVPGEDGSYVHREGGDRIDLMRTRDGGVSWQRLRGMDGVGVMSVHFQSAAEGLLVATGEGYRVDLLYRTADGGISWEREPLAPPPGLPASAVTVLDPVARPDGDVLLVLSARSRSDSERRPRWEGSYAYRRDGQRGWAGPYRLPMASARLSPPHVAVPGTDGRIWAAAGYDLFVADDPAGPWQHRQVPLPAGQVITRLDPVGDGALWLTTRKFPALAAVSGGQLYRSADDGAHWNRVTVDAT